MHTVFFVLGCPEFLNRRLIEEFNVCNSSAAPAHQDVATLHQDGALAVAPLFFLRVWHAVFPGFRVWQGKRPRVA